MTNSQQESEDAKLIQRAHMGDETVSKDDLLAVAKRAMERNTDRKKQMTPPTEEEVRCFCQCRLPDGVYFCSNECQILALDALRSAQAEIKRLESECQEQARLNGMGGERELSLRSKVERLESDNAELRARVGDATQLANTHYDGKVRYRDRWAREVARADALEVENEKLRVMKEADPLKQGAAAVAIIKSLHDRAESAESQLSSLTRKMWAFKDIADEALHILLDGECNDCCWDPEENDGPHDKDCSTFQLEQKFKDTKADAQAQNTK